MPESPEAQAQADRIAGIVPDVDTSTARPDGNPAEETPAAAPAEAQPVEEEGAEEELSPIGEPLTTPQPEDSSQAGQTPQGQDPSGGGQAGEEVSPEDDWLAKQTPTEFRIPAQQPASPQEADERWRASSREAHRFQADRALVDEFFNDRGMTLTIENGKVRATPNQEFLAKSGYDPAVVFNSLTDAEKELAASAPGEFSELVAGKVASGMTLDQIQPNSFEPERPPMATQDEWSETERWMVSAKLQTGEDQFPAFSKVKPFMLAALNTMKQEAPDLYDSFQRHPKYMMNSLYATTYIGLRQQRELEMRAAAEHADAATKKENLRQASPVAAEGGGSPAVPAGVVSTNPSDAMADRVAKARPIF